MDLLLILTYASICVAIFKLFKIPLNKWTVPTAVLGGIVILGALIVGMNYNHPYSEISRQYFVTTPIVPNVSGQVIKVPVEANTALKAGDVLLEIDPTPFQNRLDSLSAQLKMAKDDLDRAKQLVEKNVMAVRERELAQSKVDQLSADYATAAYELSQTTVRSPGNGYVTQVSVRPGTRAVSMPLRPLMVFVPTENQYFVGWFRQNSLLRLKVGDKAEVAFDGVPGKIFSGKVVYILTVLAEGQISPSGQLVSSKQAAGAGRIGVRIEITDPEFKKYMDVIPGGAYGQSVVYTEYAKHLSIMRKMLLRMAAWMNYIFPFH